MQITNTIKLLNTAYWFAFLIIFIFLGFYGKELIEWILIKLYEIFIQKDPVIV